MIPLMALSVIEKLYLLKNKFGKIIIPDAVWTEITVEGRHKKGTDDILRADWIKVESLQNTMLAKSLEKDLDYGESEAIALGMEISADIILLDDKLARTLAANLGLNILGTLGILIWARKMGLIENLRTELHNLLIHANFRMSQNLISKALREVGEDA
ncbi:DUF3368 domain-containing protein [Desulfobacterales bacterium HSG2]|nr:DUF3368 domain-containing protein [Desulfobacterales bacterium HSG2]